MAELAELIAGALDPDRLSKLDSEEAFPSAACTALDEFGLPAYYVPAADGGRLGDFSQLIRLLAAVAARDLTVAVAHGKTFLGGVATWLAGTREQRAALGGRIGAGAVVSWALTEPGHGSDLLAGEVTATRTDQGWLLNGTKWTINNATRSDVLCVLARTKPEGGNRGFGLFLLDKSGVLADRYTYVPKLHTHGVRGADISGIALHDAPVPDDALLGGAGQGMEITVKALQLTRILTTSLSLGAAAHGLRFAAEFAAARHAGVHRLADLPNVRRVLGRAVATTWLVEAVSTVAGRYVNAAPEELSVVSPVVKALVPALVDGMLAELGELLGGQGFLVAGEFEKIERDHRLVAIFDGSTDVNRYALIGQFGLLARGYAARRRNSDVAAVTDLARPVGPLRFDRLRLLSPTGCDLVQSVPEVASALSGPLVARFAALTDEVLAALADHQAAKQPPAEAFELAVRYELCFAGAACMRLYQANPGRVDATWLQACLARVMVLLGEPAEPIERDTLDGLEPAFEERLA
ncbi:acyl-CoA dehydrogenase family protein [Amycolatopsis jejuensis]|uniref:acyl-CoA dehydrogenase family protein n=1 Tax=Amycolatopsis jejuensis TaxID=330084 RepID=UPI000689BD92|nr:acyl-CoA dehydrogenase [Amycolatopsis jejuensis]